MIGHDIDTQNSLLELADFCTKVVLIAVGKLSPFISQSEAYRIYGQGVVRKWVSDRVVEKIKDGEGNSKVRYSRTHLEAAAKASNRVLHFLNKK